MRLRVFLVLAVVVIIVALGYVWTLEPRYHGRRLRIWIQAAERFQASKTDELNAAEAVRACGTNVVPFYLELFQAKLGPTPREKLVEFLQAHHLPSFHLEDRDQVIPAPIIADFGLSVLGSEAVAAIPTLTKLVLTGDDMRREFAGESLSSMGVDGAKALTNLLGSPDPVVRRFATSPLRNFGLPQGFCSATRRPEELRAAADIVVPALIANLNDPDERLRITSIHYLAAFPGTEVRVVPILLEKLRDSKSDTKTKIAVIEALKKYGSKANDVVSAILTALADPDQNLSRAAGLALLERDEAFTPVVVKRFVEIFQDERIPAIVRATTINNLGRLGKRATNAVPALLSLIRANNAMLSPTAGQALKGIDVEAAAEIGLNLMDIMRRATTRAEKIAAIRALGKFGARAKGSVPPLLWALKSNDLELRREAGISLKMIAPEEAAKAGVE